MFAYCGNEPVNRWDPSGCFWDYVLDAVFLAWSIYDVIKDPGNWKNWAALGVDLVFVVIPFVPSGAGQVIKVGNKIDNVLDVASAINKLDNVHDLSKVTMIGRNGDRVKDTAKLLGMSDNIYKPWKGYKAAKFLPEARSIGHNGLWMFGKLRAGNIVLDIGMMTMHTSRGWYYGIERFVVGLWRTRHFWKLPINYYL